MMSSSYDITGPKNDQDEKELQLYAQTRKSLIIRLKDWHDHRTWDEFYRTYWRLIYSVALKSGLAEVEAMDVVQDTVLTIAKQSREAKGYDPERGSFKSWLLSVTRWRINDQHRQRRKLNANISTEESCDYVEKQLDNESHFDELWDKEWQAHLMKAALELVKLEVSPKQFQIFDLHVLRGYDVSHVRRTLGVSMAQVYLAKHRVGNKLQKAVGHLREQEKAGESGGMPFTS